MAASVRWQETYESRRLSPRMRLAAKLYGSGIAKTLGEAAALAQLAPATVYVMHSSGNEEFRRIISDAQDARDEATGDIGAVLQRLGRRALSKITTIMDSEDMPPAVQLKAAMDLADRSPETSKIQRHAIASVSIEGKDVEALTRAMVEAALVQQQHVAVTSGDTIKVSTAVATPAALPKSNIPVQAPLTFADIKELPDAKE